MHASGEVPTPELIIDGTGIKCLPEEVRLRVGDEPLLSRRSAADAVPKLLRGAPATLAGSVDGSRSLVALPDEQGGVTLDIRSTAPLTDLPPDVEDALREGTIPPDEVDSVYPPETSSLSHPPVVVDIDSLVAAILQYTAPKDDEAHSDWYLRENYHVARQAYEHYQECGSLDGFERSYPGEMLVEYLTERAGGQSDDDVLEYARESRAVRDLVVQAAEDRALKRLGVILRGAGATDEPALLADAAEGVAAEPVAGFDPLPLLLSFWGGTEPAIAPAIRALTAVATAYPDADQPDPERIRREVRNLLADVDEHPAEIRREAARAAGELGDTDSGEHLERLAADDPDETVRAAARAALEDIGAGE